MKKSINFIGYFLVFLSLVFLFTNFTKNVNRIPGFSFSLRGILGIVLATALCTSVVVTISVAWNILVRGSNIYLSFRQSYIIIGKSQIGKYIPGNVFHYAGRILIGRQYKVPTEAVILSTLFETVIIALTGSAIAAVGLLLDHPSSQLLFFGFKIQELLVITALTLGVITSLMSITWFMPPVRDWLRLHLAYLHGGRIITSVILYTIVFILFGVSISLLIEMSWGINTNLRWYQFTWGFAAAWVIGLVTPGAPGGVGIRETILITLYSPELGEGLALGLSLMLRIVTSLGDLVAFSLAYYLDRLDRT